MSVTMDTREDVVPVTRTDIKFCATQESVASRAIKREAAQTMIVRHSPESRRVNVTR